MREETRMFGKRYVNELISRSAENAADRSVFMRSAAAAGLGLVGAGLAKSMATPSIFHRHGEEKQISDSAILNFALNLEYLEANFYSYAVNGHGLPDEMTTGTGQHGDVNGGKQVMFGSNSIKQFAKEIARDEHEHVAFFRTALGSSAASQGTSLSAQDLKPEVLTEALSRLSKNLLAERHVVPAPPAR